MKIATHAEPVWRTKADTVIAAEFMSDGAHAREQLWGRRVGDWQFEICCIPFFVDDISLGDIVETDESFHVRRVVTDSGRYVFRVWLADPGTQLALIHELQELGGLTEISSARLFAIDAPDPILAHSIADRLAEWERQSLLTYETGRTTAPPPSRESGSS
jgi:hypothetical protein